MVRSAKVGRARRLLGVDAQTHCICIWPNQN